MQTYYNAYDLSKFMFLSEEKLTQIVKSTLKKVTLTVKSKEITKAVLIILSQPSNTE